MMLRKKIFSRSFPDCLLLLLLLLREAVSAREREREREREGGGEYPGSFAYRANCVEFDDYLDLNKRKPVGGFTADVMKLH